MQDTLNIFSMRKSYMKPGHINNLGHIKQSEYVEKLHEAMPH